MPGLFGTMGNAQNMASLFDFGAGAKVPDAGPERSGRRRGGLFSNFDPSAFLMAQALMEGNTGQAAQIMAHQRQQRAAQEQAEREAEAARESEGRRMEALAGLVGPNGQPLFTKDMISSMRGQDASQRVREELASRQFGAAGGSVESTDPTTGQTSFRQAPSRHEFQGSVFDIGPDGQPIMRREGHQIVPLQPGGEAAVFNSYTGQEVTGGPQQAPQQGAGPAVGAVVNGYRFRGGNPNDRNNWEPVQGGAGGQANRPFDASGIPANFTSGRRTEYGNRLVGGVPNSAHLRGDAADFTPRPGQSMAQLEAELRRRFPGARVINEGNHVHVQQQGWGVPYHGRRGTTGLRGP